MTDQPLLVVVSIDTEEDNWTPTREDVSVTNIHAVPALQRLLHGLGARPTYFTNFAVARTPWAAAILGDIAADGQAEIGAHLHPWNTPPFREAFVPRNTMMKNLPRDLQAEKLGTLADTLETAFGTRPTAFRAGRYGIARDGVELLAAHGFTVDSSVTPFLDWRYDDEGPDFREAPLAAYRPAPTDIMTHIDDGPIVELPLSVGYTRTPFSRWARWHERFMRTRVAGHSLNGVANRTHFLRRRQLSFETATLRDMLVVSHNLASLGSRFLHLTWHTPSLVPGLSPFVRTPAERDAFFADIEQFFEQLSGAMSFSFATVSEAAALLATFDTRALLHA